MTNPLQSPDAGSEQAKELWQQCLSILKESVPPLSFKTWFEPVKALRIDNDHLVLAIPSQFFYDWLDEHYSEILRTTILTVCGPGWKITYNIPSDDDHTVFLKESESTKEEPAEPAALPASLQSATPPPLVDPFTPRFLIRMNGNTNALPRDLNPRYTFANFVKGESNQLAHAAAMAVANNPGGTTFNPLVLYGGSGLGKTHLVHAVGNQAFVSGKARRIAYVTSERFTTEFIESIQRDKTSEFSYYYRSVDLLIVDDIQFFAGKDKTQDSFFHTFNALYQLGKQIVLTSDVPPKDLEGLDERLISRFQSGLTADIQAPDLETRLAILQKKCEEHNARLSGEVVQYLASAVTKNIRELEGCLVRLIAHTSLTARPITVDLAREIVHLVVKDVSTPLTIDQIQCVVCRYYDIPEEQLRSKTRKKEIVIARQIAMYLSKEMTNSSLKTIGMFFGGRDHSTVIHSYQTVEDLSKKDSSMHHALEDLKRKLSALRT